MVSQFKLRGLTAANRKKFLKKHGERKVYIESNHGLWRPNARGYTDKISEAWILTMSEAYEQTETCGEEKRVYFRYPPEPEVEPVKLSCDDNTIRYKVTSLLDQELITPSDE